MAGPRSRARRYALLAIYQWQIGKQSAAEIERHFNNDPVWIAGITRGLCECADDDSSQAAKFAFDVQLFEELLRGVTQRIHEVDETLRPFLNRAPASVDPVELAILRLATFELSYSPAVPAAVILNEAIDLAKEFGAEQGHRFINGVLDKVAHQSVTRNSKTGSVSGES